MIEKNLMLKLKTKASLINLKLYNRILFLNNFKKFYKRITISVIGRIFRWIKGKYYMKFILPMSNKPNLFLTQTFLCKKNNDSFTFIWFKTYNTLKLLNLFNSIKNPSIFNKRGFHIQNKIVYKKRGKVTSYVTNK